MGSANSQTPVKRVEETLDQIERGHDYLKWAEVDQPEGMEEVRIRPTSENKTMNEHELVALLKAGFYVTTVDMHNEEVWLREFE